MWKQTEWPNIRQNLLENTNNIIVVEDQVILIVDLDVVPSESTCQDQQQSPKNHPKHVNRKPHTHCE